MKYLLKNKKVLFTIITIMAIILGICIIVFAVLPNLQKEEKSDKEETSYKSQIKDWAKVCDDRDELEKYVKKNVDLRAIYAANEVIKNINYLDYASMDEDEYSLKINKEFEKKYNDAKKSDYNDEDVIDSAVDGFYYKDFHNVKITDIGKLEDVNDNGIKGSKECKITAEIDDKKYEGTVIFYKEKIISVSVKEKK